MQNLPESSSSEGELALLVEWKKNNLVNETMTLESTAIEAMPGHHVTTVFSAKYNYNLPLFTPTCMERFT